MLQLLDEIFLSATRSETLEVIPKLKMSEDALAKVLEEKLTPYVQNFFEPVPAKARREIVYELYSESFDMSSLAKEPLAKPLDKALSLFRVKNLGYVTGIVGDDADNKPKKFFVVADEFDDKFIATRDISDFYSEFFVYLSNLVSEQLGPEDAKLLFSELKIEPDSYTVITSGREDFGEVFLDFLFAIHVPNFHYVSISEGYVTHTCIDDSKMRYSNTFYCLDAAHAKGFPFCSYSYIFVL